jgi:hypothetical protein
MSAYAFPSADAAAQSSHQFLDGMIAILEHERDQLIPLAVKGPVHLRSLRLRQLKSIEQRLVSVQREQSK